MLSVVSRFSKNISITFRCSKITLNKDSFLHVMYRHRDFMADCAGIWRIGMSVFQCICMYIPQHVHVSVCPSSHQYVCPTIGIFVHQNVCQYVAGYFPSIHTLVIFCNCMNVKGVLVTCLNSASVRLDILTLNIYLCMPNGACAHTNLQQCCLWQTAPRGVSTIYRHSHLDILSIQPNVILILVDVILTSIIHYVSGYCDNYYYYSICDSCVLRCIIHHYDCFTDCHHCGPSSIELAWCSSAAIVDS